MYKYDIRQRRKELGLTLQAIADIVGVTKSTVRKWENGLIDNMRRDRIVLLSKALKITPEKFMGCDSSKGPSKLVEIPSSATIEDINFFHTYLEAKNSDKAVVQYLLSAIKVILDTEDLN